MKIRIEKDCKKVPTPKKLQKAWDQIEEDGAGTDILFINGVDPVVSNILCFMALSNSMLGSYLDDWAYIFGDVDVLDCQDYGTSLIIRLEP